MGGVLVAGTTSDAGKSLVTTGLCRALARRGVDVAPFKAQNMSNNSMVCADGAEIGRAQYLQAQAARVTPTSAMNPVLLKPGDDRTSHVVVRGRPHSTLRAGEYATGRTHLADAAYAAYAELAATHAVIVCEGAGSPAEINLRRGDYVNMGLARRFGLPVVVVGDIDRGGMLAAVYGTWGLLDAADRALLTGYIVNKFRGDASVLQPGLDDLSARTGLRCFGVLPWLEDVWLDAEDALAFGRWRSSSTPGGGSLRVAVVPFRRVSNATDVDALAQEPGVDVLLSADPDVLLGADLVLLPGTRATVADLAWLRDLGVDHVLAERAARGGSILGICGGYQMLARHIDDDIESGAGRIAGLGLLPVDAAFAAEKITRLTTTTWQGHPVEGYEIHHGRCAPFASAAPFLDGVRAGQVWGTLLHGAFENDDFRRAWLTELADHAGSSWRPRPAPGYAERRETMINSLADAVEKHLDVDALLKETR